MLRAVTASQLRLPHLLTDPKGWIVILLRNGVRAAVVAWRYAMFPAKPSQ
jgi:hypothetical protein